MKMAEYIELDTTLELYVVRGSSYKKQISTLQDLLDTNRILYTVADVRPVVRGKWIKPTRVPDSMLSECSVCGFDTGAYTFNFCPNCGADMRETK
jgi:hypothetical protein